MMINHPLPLKRFGQNYLVDQNIVRKIVAEFNPQPHDFVLEIGPGTGSLTSLLQQSIGKYYAVEIDKRIIEELRSKFPKINFVNDDILKLDLDAFAAGQNKLRVIGNIPYNITSPILFKLIEKREVVQDAVLMVQLEVAKRITAKEKSKDYGILGVLLNFFSETNLCFKISPNVFYPKPKVFSAVVHLKFNKTLPADVSTNLFIQVVKAAFGNRRKTLKNSLANSKFGEIDFSNYNFDLSRRAEELSIDEFVQLTRLIQKHFEN